MESVLKEKDKISPEVALKMMQDFVERWTYVEEDFSKIEEQYPQALQAIRKGILIFNDKQEPTYTLAFPLESENDPISQINFKTRIKPLTLSNITKGIDVSKNQVLFTLKCISHLADIKEGDINRLEKFDYKVIEQVCTCFF